MAETTGSLSDRERIQKLIDYEDSLSRLRERGKYDSDRGVKSTLVDVDTEMEALGLSSVPGFERPQSAGPGDRWTLEYDELGNKIYETPSGQRYTIRLNPDQRTTRTKAEDFIEGVRENGLRLPSREQVVEVAKEIPKAVYDSVAGAVRGEGTLGDVFGMAPAMGVASAPFEVPEGSLRIFGGRKATNPGIDSNGNLLPQSLGKDGEPRFEIVDKDAKFNLHDMSFIDTKKEITSISDFGYSDSLPSWSRPYKFLNEVFEHDELYRQYPSIGDIRVVIDNTLTGSTTLGYFADTYNLIALNPSLKPEEVMSTLLHEIQHKVQRIEGFSKGTSVRSQEVVAIAETVHALKLNEHELAKAAYPEKLKAYEKAKAEHELKLKDFKNFDYRDIAHVQLGFLTDMAEELGLPFDEFFSKPLDSVSILENRPLWVLLSDRDRLLKFIDEWGITETNPFATPNTSFNFHLYKDLPGFEESGQNWFGKEAWEKIKTEESLYPILPKKPRFPDFPPRKPFPPSPTPDYFSYFEAYKRKAGETEARNVSKRKDMTLEERFANPPESTEDRPRDLQWTEFAKGGEVKKDPVSGNKVPPNGTAKGVRDDVPALLSEGEYVIPENVVNTYGAETFDKLVQQTNDMLKTQPGKVQKMAKGGFVENPTEADIVSGFNPDAYRTVGYSYFGSTAPTTQVSYTYVTYINSNGDTIQVRVDANGNPLDPVPTGYVPQSQATMTAEQKRLEEQRGDGSNSLEQDQDTFTSYYTYTEEQFQKMLEDPTGLEKTMMDLFGGGVFGGLIEQDRITNLEAAAVVANDLGYTEVAQELLDKSKTLASEAGEPGKLTEWLSADAANVVDRHRKAAPEGLLDSLSLTPVEPGKPISLDGRTPPPEAFTSTGVPATTTPVPVTNPNQYPLGEGVVQLEPTTAPTPGTTMESVNDPVFRGVTPTTPSPTPIETTTLPPAPTTTPTTTTTTGKSIVPADPRNAYTAWDQMVVGGMPEGYNRNPSIPAPAPFKQQTPDVAGFTQPNAAQGFAPVPNTTTDASPVGRSPVGPSYPFVQPSTLTPGPQPVVGPTYTPVPPPPAPAPTYYANDPRLNVPTSGMPAAPHSVAVSTTAPTQPQAPGIVPQYIPGIDQGVTTTPTMPGELVTSPVPQAPTVGVAPVVNTQPPASPAPNPASYSTYVPGQPPRPTAQPATGAVLTQPIQPAPDANYRAPTLYGNTPVPTSEKNLGFPPSPFTSDAPVPPQQPPVPPGTTTAKVAGAQVPPGTAGAVIPEGAAYASVSNEGLSSERIGLQVMSTPGSNNPAKVIGMDGKAYEVPVGETVIIDGQTVTYDGKGNVNINGLNGVVGDIYPATHFVNQGQQAATTPATEPVVSQKNVTSTPKPPESNWVSQTSLPVQEPFKVTQVSIDRYANSNADLVNAAKQAAQMYDIPEELLLGMITQESQWNPNAVSPVGAQGLTQIMPATAENPGYGVTPLQNWSVQEQLRFGAEYLKALEQEFGSYEEALKAYNQGPGNTKNGILTDETAKYVPQVFQAADEWEKYQEEIERYVPDEYSSFDQVTGQSDFSDLSYGDLISTGDGESTETKTPTPVPTTTDLTTFSFGDTISTPTGGGNVAPIEDYDTDNQPFAKGGLVKKRPAKYSKGGLVKRRIMATRK